MSRQITISRDELGLDPLDLHDLSAGFLVSDEWKPGGVLWQRFNSNGSAWVHGERLVGQRKIGVDEIFTIYISGGDAAGVRTRYLELVAALSQFDYTFTVEWDGAVFEFVANGAAEIHTKEDAVDPLLMLNGWQAYEITIPRRP